MANFIYGLYEGSTLRHISQTKDLKKRFQQHCCLPQNRGNRRVSRRLFRLLKQGLKPTVAVLVETTTPDEKERFGSHIIECRIKICSM
jgi:hypothetical protein